MNHQVLRKQLDQAKQFHSNIIAMEATYKKSPNVDPRLYERQISSVDRLIQSTEKEISTLSIKCTAARLHETTRY